MEKLYRNDRARREGYARLGGRKQRRIRDRNDIEGLPSILTERGKYQDYLHKGGKLQLPKSNVALRFAGRVRREMPKLQTTDIPRYAKYLAEHFVAELQRSTVDGITDEMERTLQIVRARAEKQLAKKLPEIRAERDYLLRLKAYVAKQIQLSAVKWKADLFEALPKATEKTLWDILLTKELEAKRMATLSARTLIGAVYNQYMAWMLDKGGGAEYKWVNPLDKRTSTVCKKIVQRAAGGVNLDEMKEIIRQEADSSWYKERSPYLPHPQCRSALVLVR